MRRLFSAPLFQPRCKPLESHFSAVPGSRSYATPHGKRYALPVRQPQAPRWKPGPDQEASGTSSGFKWPSRFRELIKGSQKPGCLPLIQPDLIPGFQNTHRFILHTPLLGRGLYRDFRDQVLLSFLNRSKPAGIPRSAAVRSARIRWLRSRLVPG